MTKEFRVLRADFGNGAEQTAPNGTNNAVEHWNVRFDNLDSTGYSAVVTGFLETLNGSERIDWNSKYYKLDGSYSVQYHAGSVYTVSFNLRQVFA